MWKNICLFMQAVKYFYFWREILICWMSVHLGNSFPLLVKLTKSKIFSRSRLKKQPFACWSTMMAFRKVQTLYLEHMMSTNQWDDWSKVERNSCNCSCTMEQVKFVDNKCIRITQGLGHLFPWAQCKRWNTCGVYFGFQGLIIHHIIAPHIFSTRIVFIVFYVISKCVWDIFGIVL
jgi:hypothetical protein